MGTGSVLPFGLVSMKSFVRMSIVPSQQVFVVWKAKYHRFVVGLEQVDQLESLDADTFHTNMLLL